jgi:hypothetical protein
MLVLLTALVVGVGAGCLAGGRLRNLERLDLSWPWIVIAALGLQLVAFSPAGAALGPAAMVTLHFASYALLAWFVALNRRHVGVLVAGLGLALNLAVIAANGGYMPASKGALQLAGVAYAGTVHNNSAVIAAGTHLRLLGDIFAVPAWIPAANVFSLGDLLVVAGVVIVLVAAMRGPRVVVEAS